jgi:hypothetical protein
VRLHLLGHSFGARAISYALAGLPTESLEDASPVKSLVMLQGAFSHFAFADALPHNTDKPGALTGMAARVDGPLVACHSEHDTALGRFYPLACMAVGDDAAGVDDVLFRWGAIGHDGAQEVDAGIELLGPVGVTYPFAAGGFLNLDGSDVIKKGGFPSGAHSDIIHPETAWVSLSAAGILTGA